MFYGELLMGSTLVFFAAWLQWTESRGWPHDSLDSDEAIDQQYLARRGKSRRLVNSLIGICGALILSAAFAGAGVVFVAAWSTVAMILFVIIILAGLDAFRTHRHHSDKIRQIRERALDE